MKLTEAPRLRTECISGRSQNTREGTISWMCLSNQKKLAEITWEGWRALLDDGSLFREMEQRFFARCVPWISVMRGAYHVNVTSWNTCSGQCQEIFFRILRQSPLYNEQQENQWRRTWETVQKAQQIQQEVFADTFDRIEALAKDRHGRH